MKLRELKTDWDRLGKSDPIGVLIGGDWDKTYRDISQIRAVYEHGRRELAQVMSELKARGMFTRGGKALDFGCGVGRISQAMCEYFDRVDGVDISPSMLKIAEAHNSYPDQCHYVLNDSNDLKIFPDESFDFIYSIGTLIHIRPKYVWDYLREFLRILSAQGTMVFELVEHKRTLSRFIWALKQELRPVIPRFLLGAYRRLRGIAPSIPTIETHSMARQDVIPFLTAKGGIVEATMPREETEAFYVMYIVRRSLRP